ncbi:MAG: HAD hydrolase family protein, partial [Desulfobacterales bacterium]|nr:HAD hydrolase family protein [Desulfobacterales bacterium]
LDVDGVLTQGHIIYDDHGAEIKAFNVKDGLGIRLLMKKGIPVGIVTGRSSTSLLSRCNDLNIDMVFHGITNKRAILGHILSSCDILPEHIAYMGDDIPDIGIMEQVGFPIAVADAHDEVKKQAIWITKAKGGHGAVREVIEMILKSKGVWEEVLMEFR